MSGGKAGRIATHVVRTLLGLMFAAFGVIGSLNLMKPPENTPANIMNVLNVLKSIHLMEFVSGMQLLVGVLLLVNVFVPLALTLLAPILVGIILFHLSLSPGEIVPGIVVTVMELYLAWVYRAAFRPMLAMKVRPS